MATPHPESKQNVELLREKYGISKILTANIIEYWRLDMSAVKKVFEVIDIKNPKVRADIALCTGYEISQIAMNVSEVNHDTKLLYTPYDKDTWVALLLTAQSPHIQAQIYRGSAVEFTTNPHQPNEALLLLSQNPNLAPELIEIIVQSAKNSLTYNGFNQKFEEPSALGIGKEKLTNSAHEATVFGGKLHVEAIDQLCSKIRGIRDSQNPNTSLIKALLLTSSNEARKYDVLEHYLGRSYRVPVELFVFLTDEQINEFTLLTKNPYSIFNCLQTPSIHLDTINELASRYPIGSENLILENKSYNWYLWICITNHPNCPPALITTFEEWYTSLSTPEKNKFLKSSSLEIFTKTPLIQKAQIQF